MSYPIGPRTYGGIQPNTPNYQNNAEHKYTASHYDDHMAQVLEAISKKPIGSSCHQKKSWYGR